MPETHDILDRWFDGYEPADQSIDQLIGVARSGASALVHAAILELRLRRAARLPSATVPEPVRNRSRRTPFALAAAAVLALLIGAVWLAVHPRHRGAGALTAGTILVNGNRSDRVPEGGPFEVPSGLPADLRLSDGSLLKIDAGSRVAVQMATPQARIVRLMAGAAGFDVTPQAREFRVETALGNVRVLGTRFRVALLSSPMLQVSVRQGTVTVECGHGTTTLTGGQQREFVLLADGRGGPLVHGTIRSIDFQDHSLQLTDPSKRPYRFGAVGVTLNGKSATPNALTPGMPATLVLSPNESEVMEIRAQSRADP